jgi:hypothetical protein
MGLETVEAVGPFGMGVSEPVVHWDQARELEPRRAALAVPGPTDEAGPLQHLEVFGDGGLRERGGSCKLEDAGLAGHEALEYRPAGGVGQGGEGAAQGVVSSHHRQVI